MRFASYIFNLMKIIISTLILYFGSHVHSYLFRHSRIHQIIGKLFKKKLIKLFEEIEHRIWEEDREQIALLECEMHLSSNTVFPRQFTPFHHPISLCPQCGNSNR